MSSSADLRRAIESQEVHHSIFMEHYTWLRRRTDDAIEGFAPRIERLVGPSRVGKSMILDALVREYPQTREGGVRRAPVLKVKVPPSVSPKLFPVAIFGALGVPVPTRSGSSSATSGALLERACDQLRLASTRAVLLEEASHFVELSARVRPRAAGDMLKDLSDNAAVSIMLFGVPRLQMLFDSNEQLRLRASKPRIFLPYDFGNVNHRKEFAACVKTYADLFAEHGWPIEVEFSVLVKHCYLHSGGLFGVLSHFMKELSIRPRGETPRPLTMEDCREAAELVEGAGHPFHEPFMKEEISLAELGQAYGHVMEINDLATAIRR